MTDLETACRELVAEWDKPTNIRMKAYECAEELEETLEEHTGNKNE
jgi:hypothetical protein